MPSFRCFAPVKSRAFAQIFLASLLCAALASVLEPAAQAQVQFLGQTLSTTDYGLGPNYGGSPGEGGPLQVAVNASGTIAAGTVNANQIIRINPDGSHQVAFTSPSGFIFAVAIDNAGNIYTNNQSTLWKIAPNGTVTSTDLGLESTIQSYCTALQNEGGGYAPTCEYQTAAQDLAIDPQGNIYVSYVEPLWWVLEVPAGGGAPFLLDTSPLIMNVPTGLATDSQGNVYIGDVYNDRIIVVTPVGQSNYGVDPPGLALGSPWMTIDGVTLYQGVSSLGVDSEGNIYAGSTRYNGAQQFLARIDASGQSYVMLPVGGDGVAGIGVDGQDNLYFANNDGFLVKYATKPPIFNTVAVGAAAPTVSLPFNIAAGTTVGSLSFMTGSAQNLDFKDAGSDTCTFPRTFTSTTTCTVNVSFTPTAPGLRAGALIFADAGGNVLLSMALQGTGTGPLPVFNSRAETLLTSKSLQYPLFGTTVSDQSGNLYIAFASQNEILEVPQGGASSVLSLGSATTDPQQPAISATLSGPSAVAMDNTGRLYIADTGNDRIVVRQPVPGSTTGQYFLYALPLGGITLNAPNGVGADAAGNVYIMDNGNSRVIKVTASGHASVLPNVNIGNQPVFGFTVDPAGNLFLCGNGEVVEYAAGSLTPSILYSGNPQGVAVDPGGDLYIADYDTREGLVEIPVGGTAQTLSIGLAGSLQEPSAVSIDSAGNLYITNAYGVDEIPRSTAALSFATSVLNEISPDSPQTAQFANAGNASMSLSSVTYPSDFPENTSDSALCVAGTALSPGAACDVSADFKPASTGTLTESVTITDSSINPTSTLSLTGTGSAGGQSQTIAILNAQLMPGNICCGSYPYGPGFYVNSTSGLPVTLTVLSGPMTFNGSLTTTVNTTVGSNTRLIPSASGAGSGVVQASQPGNSAYAPAAPVQLTYTVNPDSISVRFNSSGTQTYGSATPTLTYTLSGVLAGDKVGLAVTGGVSAASPVGSYTANVALTGLSAANYTLSNPTLPVTVTPAPLTVEPVDAYQLVGATPAPLNYVLAGFQNGDTASVVTGSPTLSTTATASSPAGTYPITAGAGTLAAANYAFTSLPNGELNILAPVNLGAVNVGIHMGTEVTFPAGPAPGAASLQLLTGGSTSGAFAGGHLACTAGTLGSCNVTMSFAPTAPGLVTGAMNLYDNASPANLLVSVPIYGTGVAPQIAFSGGAQSIFANHVDGVNGTAFDGSGNTYITTWSGAQGGAVYELSAAGALTPIGSGWSYPDSVAVDGAGNIYVADADLNEVIKITSAGVQSTVPFTSLLSPQALALDAVDDLYVSSGGATIYKITPAGAQSTYYQGSSADGFPTVNSIAFSPTGQLYFADGFHGSIDTASQGGLATLVSSAIPGAAAIAFDAAGDIYAATYAPAAAGLYELTPTGSVSQLIAESDSASPLSVALDPSGNVYLGNASNDPSYLPGQIVKLDQVDAPALNFPLPSTLSLNLTNIGNATLSFPIPASGNNPALSAGFTYNSTAPSACPLVTPASSSAGSLVSGASCALSVTFAPTQPGSTAGTLVLTDSNLNQGANGYATQTLALSGTYPTQTISFAPPSPVANGTAPITLVATGGASGNPVIFSIVSGPGSLSGANNSVLTITGTGSIVIAANQAGNSSYAAAPQVTATITVTNAPPATMTSPAAGAIFAGPGVTFTWTAAPGATGYYLLIGTTGAGSNNLYNSAQKTATSYTSGNMPANGQPVYVRLITNFSGNWVYNDYIYTEAAQAAMTAPAQGSVFAGPTVAFSWSAAPNATGYYLWIGTTGAGSNNLYNSALKTVTSYTFGTVPANGETIYVRLITNFSGTWAYTDYVYTAASQASMLSPAQGAVFMGPSVSFSWTAAANATSYYLQIGSTGAGSSNLYNSAPKTATSYTFTAMPTNGETINVRLITNYNGTWVHTDYTYVAAAQALLTSPTAGSMFAGSSVTFTWSAAPNVTNYYLLIGSTGVGSYNIYSSAPKTVTSYTFNGMPTNGETIYVRLVSNFNGTWLNKDYTFKAEAIPAVMTSPAAGSTLTGPSATFTWSAPSGVTGYYLWIGTTGVGSSDLYFSAEKTANLYTFSSLPTNGAPIYVRLISNYNGTWVTSDYVYTAAAQAVMTSPAAGSTLAGSGVTFTWSVSSSATNYYLQIGSTAIGSDNIYNSAPKTVTTFTYPAMPTNGETIYVRLITNFNGIWVHNDYQFTAAQ